MIWQLKSLTKYSFDQTKIIPIKQIDINIWEEKRVNKILLDNSLLKEILGLKEIKIDI